MLDLSILDVKTWNVATLLIFSAAIMGGLEILSHIIPLVCSSAGSKLIPVKGKHLDELSQLDKTYIWINKCFTVLFVYHLLWLTPQFSSITWEMSKISLLNTVGSMASFYVFYDFFYMNFHRILHIRGLYSYIHKHHHRQKAPSRGNLDAINVHPFEFVVGEYLHLVTIYFIPCHIVTVVAFILLGGILASLNHTRFDVSIPGLYSVKWHDVHHRLPESNYGQYTMFWDHVFGSYRDYAKVSSAKDEY